MPVPQTCSRRQKFPLGRQLPASGIQRLSISQNAGLFSFVSTYGEIGSFMSPLLLHRGSSTFHSQQKRAWRVRLPLRICCRSLRTLTPPAPADNKQWEKSHGVSTVFTSRR